MARSIAPPVSRIGSGPTMVMYIDALHNGQYAVIHNLGYVPFVSFVANSGGVVLGNINPHVLDVTTTYVTFSEFNNGGNYAYITVYLW